MFNNYRLEYKEIKSMDLSRKLNPTLKSSLKGLKLRLNLKPNVLYTGD